MCSINLLSFRRCPDSLDVNSLPAGSPTDPSAFPLETDALQIEEVQPPASGTRKAKVLYDYDAADSSELSLRADEVSRCLMEDKWSDMSLIGVLVAVKSSAVYHQQSHDTMRITIQRP